MEKLSKTDLVALFEEFIDDGDKNSPPYFAGRKKVLSDIENACAQSWERHIAKGRQRKAATRVIYGAPGAGKTSTLNYLRDCWEGESESYATPDKNGAVRPQPVPLVYLLESGSALDDPKRFCEELANVLAPGIGDTVLDFASSTQRIGTGVKIVVAEAKGETETTTHSSVPAASLATVLKAVPPEQWTRPLVIAVDETQNLVQTRDCFAGKLFQELHAGQYDAPITLVLGGLSDSIRRAGELGLTRLSRHCVHSLDRFDAEEVAELKKGFCATFELDISSREAELDAMLAACDGWPSHLTNGLYAFCKVFLDRDCDISRVDFAEVERISMAERHQYYNYRISEAMDGSGFVLADVMRQIDGGQRPGEVMEIIELRAMAGEHSRLRRDRLHDGMTAKQFYEDLTHHGALQVRDDGTVECPIPSFRRFILETYSRPAVESPESDASDADESDRRERRLPPAHPAGAVH